jgi:hypothetical protein
MKKKIIAFALWSALLTACAGPKYKISDHNMKGYIESARGVQQCINPNLTTAAASLSLSKDEDALLDAYREKLLVDRIGYPAWDTIRRDAKSWDYFTEKLGKMREDKTVSVKPLSEEQCSAIKSKFHQELAERRIQQQQQQIAQAQREEQRRIDKAKADEFRAWYVGQMMSQDLKSRGNQHRVIIQHQ